MRSRGRLLAGAALVALLLGMGGARAQDDAPDPARVMALLAEGQAALDAGDLDAAYARIAEANDMTFRSSAYDALTRHLPSLHLARLYREHRNWSEVERFAASLASALDTPEHGDHPARTEARMLTGIAASGEERYSEAATLLQGAAAAAAATGQTALQNEARYYQAYASLRLRLPDALDLAGQVLAADMFALDVPFDHLAEFFFGVMAQSHRSGAVPLADLAETYRPFLDILDARDEIDVNDRRRHHNSYALMLLESGNPEAALPVFLESQRQLGELDPLPESWFTTAEYISGAYYNLNQPEKGIRVLEAALGRARAQGVRAERVKPLLRALGYLSRLAGREDDAQRWFREAYAEMRAVRPSNDPDVLEMRALLDLDRPETAAFAFAPELGLTDQIVLPGDDAGAAALGLFLAGDYLALDGVTERDMQQVDTRADAAGVLLNRALADGLLGNRAEALVALTVAREAALQAGPAAVPPPDAPMFDIAELVATVWGSDVPGPEPDAALERLAARESALTDTERRLYLALGSLRAQRQAQSAVSRDYARRLHALGPPPSGAPGPWEGFAAALTLETVHGALPPEDVADAITRARGVVDALPNLRLLSDYATSAVLLNGPDSLTDAAVTEYGILLTRYESMVPPHHGLIGTMQYKLGDALSQRGRIEEAMVWMDRATETFRMHPAMRHEVIAFLIAQRANLMARVGQANSAATLGREAFDMVSTADERGDLVVLVATTYAGLVWGRFNDPARVIDILEPFRQDADFHARLPATARADLALTYGTALIRVGTMEETRAVFVEALADIEGEETQTLDRWRAILLQNLSIAEYWAGNPGTGFAQINAGNRIEQALIRSGNAEYLSPQAIEAARNWAVWEAMMGWDYAQTLPE